MRRHPNSTVAAGAHSAENPSDSRRKLSRPEPGFLFAFPLNLGAIERNGASEIQHVAGGGPGAVSDDLFQDFDVVAQNRSRSNGGMLTCRAFGG